MAKKVVNEMPHSLEAEQALLGCIMMDTRIQVEVAPYLKESDFYAESHKYIINAMKEIINQNKSVDFVTLTDNLEKSGVLEQAGGISYITALTDIMPSTANYQEYYNIVTRDSVLRKLIQSSSETIEECKDCKDKVKAISNAEKRIFDISQEEDNKEAKKIVEIIPEVMAKFDELSKNKGGARGISTGFTGLDHLLNGLHKSDLFVLAARPGFGKTSLAMNIIENVARQGYSCAVFSLEMSKEQIVQRLLCSVANVSMGHALRGQMDKTEWLKIAKAREELSKTKIFIDDSSLITVREIMSKCRRIKRKFGLDLVVIDYIQLMSSPDSKKSENRQQEISEISRNFKILAKEIDVPVIALSQLSRAVENRKGRPQLSDLRESGAIEQDADIVAFIHRPDKGGASEQDIANGKVQENVAEVLIEKHRNGECGVVKLFFKGECTKFLNLNENGEPEDREIKQNTTDNNVKGYEELPVSKQEEEKPISEDPLFG